MSVSSSRLPGKQRKAMLTAPLHRRQRMVAVHLERSLIREYNTRSLPVVKGDTVKILRGREGVRGVEAKVANVDLKRLRITVEGVTHPKADGTEVALPVDPSNCIITKLDLSDPRRKEKLTKLKEGQR